MYFRLLALEDVNITYENNDFVNCADQFYLKTLYSFTVFMVSCTFLSSYCLKMFWYFRFFAILFWWIAFEKWNAENI